MKYPQLSLDEVKGPKAVIETTMGTITAQLFQSTHLKRLKTLLN